jgi:hypothetical protein
LRISGGILSCSVYDILVCHLSGDVFMNSKGEVIQVVNFPLAVIPLAETETVFSLTVKANKTNSGTIYVGNSASIVFPLFAGESITLNQVKPNEVWILGDTVGDKYFVIFGGSLLSNSGDRK